VATKTKPLPASENLFEQQRSETPEPGIYERISFNEYLAWNAVSNSRLNLLQKSPRHFQKGFSKEPTPAMQLGQLYHCGVLEPLAFANRYAILPDFHKYAENCTADGTQSSSTQTKFVKERTREFTAMMEGREVVSREWYEQTMALVVELNANEEARRLLNDQGDSELSIIWEENGIVCKARIDKVAVTHGAIVDLKSTAAIDKFAKSIASYGYHRQMAHYQRGWKELTGDTLTPWLVAVESSEPFAVQAAPVSEEALEVGHGERRRLLEQLKQCRAENVWPPMPNPPQWNLPAWYGDGDEAIELTINGKAMEV